MSKAESRGQIEEIVAVMFQGAAQQSAVLWSLFEAYPKTLTGEELLAKVLERVPPKPKDLKRDGERAERGIDVKAARLTALRKVEEKVRDKLEQYYAVERFPKPRWKVELRPGAYRLILTSLVKETEMFWAPHTKGETLILCNELMFYQDFKRNSAIRFFDVNPDYSADKDTKLKELGSRAKGVEPVHVYAVTGEVLAADVFIDWLTRNGAKASRRFTRDVNDKKGLVNAGQHGVLLGSERVNKQMKLKDVPYRFTERFGELKIMNVHPDEKKMLDSLGAGLRNGIIPARKGMGGFAYGFVCRFPTPGVRGSVTTVIASDYTPVTERIAAALVDEEQMKEILKQVGSSVPERFAWLFAVETEPGGEHNRVSDAQLIGWRPT